MARALITESILTDLASAIRAKNGSTSTYTPSQMVSAIGSLKIESVDWKSFIENRLISGGTYYDSSIVRVGVGAFYGNQLTSVECPKATYISSYAFYSGRYLQTASFASASTIGEAAFYSCPSLANLYFPRVSFIQYSAFAQCTSLTQASFSLVSSASLWSNAFFYCRNLSVINFPLLESVQQSVFANCGMSAENISINLPKVKIIGTQAFYSAHFTSLSLSVCTTIGSSAFQWNQKLTTVNLPEVLTVYQNAFSSCSLLTTVNLPKVTTMTGVGIFWQCSALSKLKLLKLQSASQNFNTIPNIHTFIFQDLSSIYGSNCFRSCYNLLSLYLLSTSIVTLASSSAFSYTPISTYTTSTGGVYGSIFVPSSLYSSQKTATNWVYYSARFASLTDAQISAILNS